MGTPTLSGAVGPSLWSWGSPLIPSSSHPAHPPTPAWRLCFYGSFSQGQSHCVISPSSCTPQRNPSRPPTALRVKPGPLVMAQPTLLTSSGITPQPHTPTLSHSHSNHRGGLYAHSSNSSLPPNAEVCTCPHAFHSYPHPHWLASTLFILQITAQIPLPPGSIPDHPPTPSYTLCDYSLLVCITVIIRLVSDH